MRLAKRLYLNRPHTFLGTSSFNVSTAYVPDEMFVGIAFGTVQVHVCGSPLAVCVAPDWVWCGLGAVGAGALGFVPRRMSVHGAAATTGGAVFGHACILSANGWLD